MAAHAERTLARQMAVQVLYQAEVTGTEALDILEHPEPVPDGGKLPAYSSTLVQGVCEHLEAIDELLAHSSDNWALDRMPMVDRAIMRLAVYEMRYAEDVPVSVAINEAVELARAFGGEDDSSKFVNGVLGRISRSGDSTNTEATPESKQPTTNEGDE